MDFAKKQLAKYGWTEGKGLGKNEDGISEPLKPKLKFDNSGVGHDVGQDFTNNWWERVFNNAANNIDVQLDENQVKLELKDEPVEITTSYCKRDFKKNKDLEYGSFLKTAKLTASGTESLGVKAPESLASFSALTDDELFAACGGRTAHKGARHGLKLSGKLSRIEKQEKLLLKKMKNVSLTDNSSLEKKIKKIKKHKDSTKQGESSETSNSTTKKSKKKRKSVTFNDETVIKYYTPDLDTSAESIKDDNGNIAGLDANSNTCDEGIEQDFDDSNFDPCSISDDSEKDYKDLSRAERKKLKKMRKLAKKKRATALFIEEVREELSVNDEHCKKRKLVVEEVDYEVRSPTTKDSKKTKYVPEKIRKKERRREKKLMKSIVASLDNFCKISDVD